MLPSALQAEDGSLMAWHLSSLKDIERKYRRKGLIMEPPSSSAFQDKNLTEQFASIIDTVNRSTTNMYSMNAFFN